jgi:F-type H+-transporting ATPase subunit a
MKMITNLFSIFDPSASLWSTRWLILILSGIIMSVSPWKTSITIAIPLKSTIKAIKKETGYTLGKESQRSQNTLILLLILILPLNFIALYPQTFSRTAHLTVNLPLALSTWIAIVAYGWTKSPNHILTHLLPQGTPTGLINFMVLIEITRNIIRPITLCVRLTANLIAGHLLISLLGSAILSIEGILILPAMILPLILTILERAVACIQAYVFITLISLYVTEIK